MSLPCRRIGLSEDQQNHRVNQANELDCKGQPQVLCTHQHCLMRFTQALGLVPLGRSTHASIWLYATVRRSLSELTSEACDRAER